MKRFFKLLAVTVFTVTVSAGTSSLFQFFIPQKVVVVEKEAVFNPTDLFKTTSPPEFGTGWVKDETAVNAILEKSTIKGFDETPAGLVAADELPDHVYLWQNYEKIFNKPKPTKNQGSVGSCVGFGTAGAVEISLLAEIVHDGLFKYGEISEESIYAFSRVEIGGGRLSGDGSVGAWAADAVKQKGYLFKMKYPPDYDLTKYNEQRCRSWGNSGVPDELEPEASKYRAGDASLITSWKEAKKALAQGYGLAVCSNQGFTMQRDNKGICYPQGQWMHCLRCDGYYIDPITKKEYGHITNSWGPNAHTGNVGWGNPPTDGFWADASVINGMLSQRDSWAFSAVKGFPAKKLVWIKQVKPIFKNNPLELALAW